MVRNVVPHFRGRAAQADDRTERAEHDKRQDQAIFDRRRAFPILSELAWPFQHCMSLEFRFAPNWVYPERINKLYHDGTNGMNDMLVIVAAALVDSDGRVLVQQRATGRTMAGLWEFPGGKIEPGETTEAALVRELTEELGIATETACLAPAGFGTASREEGGQILLLLYVCRKWRGIPRALDAAAIRWVKPHQLHELPMPPADIPLIGLLDALI